MTTVAHWGTFEVANLGDLLFPLVLEHHLRAANREVEVQWVGPLGGTAPMGLGRAVARALPFEHEGFWQQASTVDAFVLGGGDLVHYGEVVIDHVKGLKPGHGYDALRGEYGDLFKKGIVDAAKVTRSALQNAASIAAMVLTTETLVTDIPEKKDAMPAGAGHHGGDMDF